MMSTIIFYTALPHNGYPTLHCYFPVRSQSLPDQQCQRFRDILNIIVDEDLSSAVASKLEYHIYLEKKTARATIERVMILPLAQNIT